MHILRITAATHLLLKPITFLSYSFCSSSQFDPQRIQHLGVYYKGLTDQLISIHSELDLLNPTPTQKQRVIDLVSNYNISRLMGILNTIKKERRIRFPHASRIESMKGYLSTIFGTLSSYSTITYQISKEKKEILSVLALTEKDVTAYCQSLSIKQPSNMSCFNISLSQVNQHLQMQIDYARNQHQRMWQIYETAENIFRLQPALFRQKQHFIEAINIIYTDQVFENAPNLDREQIRLCYEQCQQEISKKIEELNEIMSGVSARIQYLESEMASQKSCK